VIALERHGHLAIPAAVRQCLLAISPATVDRLLSGMRQKEAAYQLEGGGISHLKQQVPIRTFAEWSGAVPGFVEADLVFHCGGDVSGSHLHTLTLTDVVTGWTECLVLLFRDQRLVLQAIGQAEAQLPFPLLAIDTDNGREFLNETLLGYCRDREIIFTRSRPYKKNDQCYVEQKNGAIVRQFVGYDRFEGVKPARILTELYRCLRLYINFFQPSLKLLTKKRVGSRVIRQYDRAQTPYQRVLTATSVADEVKLKLKRQYQTLDPLKLLTDIRQLQDELWAYAYVAPTLSLQPDQLLPASSNGHNGTEKKIQTKPTTIEGASRKYRRSRKKRRPVQGERWWRTRQDPFAKVWPDLQRQLAATPDLSATELFQQLRLQYPDRFTQGQLRTLQRRVRTWRLAYIAGEEDTQTVLGIMVAAD
jgi:hypothetical protein